MARQRRPHASSAIRLRVRQQGSRRCGANRSSTRRTCSDPTRPHWSLSAASRTRTEFRRPHRRTVRTMPHRRTDSHRRTEELQHCYMCKQKYSLIHDFYDQLCPECAAFNFRKRTELADLRGRMALLTGGRVKIGYQAGLKLLRAGARLIVTTRFPRDAAKRYAQESGFRASGENGWRSSVWTCATRPASKRSAASCSPRATASTSSSTTRVRPFGGHRTSTHT